jgi:hypothetical protein
MHELLESAVSILINADESDSSQNVAKGYIDLFIKTYGKPLLAARRAPRTPAELAAVQDLVADLDEEAPPDIVHHDLQAIAEGIWQEQREEKLRELGLL